MTVEETRTNVLPYFVWPGTVKAAAAEVLSALEGTQAGVSACAGLDAATASSWADFYASAKPFLAAEADSPSIWGLGGQLDQVESYNATLYQWQKLLAGKSCTPTTPAIDPALPVSPAASLLVTALEWSVVAVVAVAGAYGIAKVAEMVPSGPRRELAQHNPVDVVESRRRALSRAKSRFKAAKRRGMPAWQKAEWEREIADLQAQLDASIAARG